MTSVQTVPVRDPGTAVPAPAPAPRTSARVALVVAAGVASCALYANLSFAVRDPADYRFFPPFLPHVNANSNGHLGGEYFFMARSLAAGDGFANPFQVRTGATAWQPPLLPL